MKLCFTPSGWLVVLMDLAAGCFVDNINAFDKAAFAKDNTAGAARSLCIRSL